LSCNENKIKIRRLENLGPRQHCGNAYIFFSYFLIVFPENRKPNKQARKWIFNDCGAVGRFGPTEDMCNQTYSGTPIQSIDFFVKEGMQFFTVPKAGKYKITASAPGGKYFLRQF